MTTTSSMHPATAWWRPQTIHAIPRVASGVGRKESPSSTASVVAFRALVTFTVILLLSPQAWFPALGQLRIAFVAAVLAIGAHLLDRMVHGRGDAPPINAEIGIALLLVAWAVITVPVSYWVGGSVEVLTSTYLKAVAFFWLVGTLATSERRLRTIAWTLVCCAVPLAIVGIKNYLAGDVLSTGVPGLTRIYGYMGGSGLAANPNDLALMLNLIIPIAAAMMIATRKLMLRGLAAAVMLLSVGGVIVTFSRAGFLTLSATGIMLLAVLIRRHSAGAAGFLVVVALVAPLFVPDSYFKRLSTITDMQADQTGSAQGRWQDVVMATGIVLHNPIVGAGIGNDMLALNKYRGKATFRSVHNAYLQYAVDLGLPGMLLFAWLHITCFRIARRVEQRSKWDDALRPLGPLAAGIQVSLAAFFVAAMFHPIAYQFYFFTIAGLAVALHNTARSMATAAAPMPALARRAAVAAAS
ncbi:MAG TPA: O-antigen ligase family protein [Vicinamibacterales bacterium]|nr:O-antigen ligase family protein [Vicinamibacterales bacterium]